ncbi:MAG: long-chain fatty acid--CoA ligase [Deltaproteobacteria bacterium]|nr:long-chain fatty acid--CoA ligase [Deltaproteobacteria bacterium]
MNTKAENQHNSSSSAALNLVTAFHATCSKFGDKTAVKSKRTGSWQMLTFSQLAKRVRNLANGFISLGIKAGDRVAVLANTDTEWVLTYLAILSVRAIAVPIYQSNKASECLHIIENSGARWIAADTSEQLNKIRSIIESLSEVAGLLCLLGGAIQKNEHNLCDLEDLGRQHYQSSKAEYDNSIKEINTDELACILYTSGTTGLPKGVMLTHNNWIFQAKGVKNINLLNHEDILMLFLPLAHSFAQVVIAAWTYLGFVLVFPESIEKIIDNAAESQPTVIPAVPRIFEKAFANIVHKGLAQHGLKLSLFKMALSAIDGYAASCEQKRKCTSLKFLLSKILVYPKLAKLLRERFGGRVRLFVSGGAPLAPTIGHFFDVLGITIVEGYGLSETSAPVCVNLPEQNKIGTVGPAFPDVNIVIADDGEIMVKGGCIMKGYWNNPVATAEVMQNGYFATGDIGMLDEDGYLKITDRKKDIIVTAAGKNVAPQNIENALKTDSIISQVMVHGDKRKYLTALITLNEEVALRWAAKNNLPNLSLAELAIHAVMIAHMQTLIDNVNLKQASYAGIKRFIILPQDFSIESGELTPTLKVKRKVCTEKYQAILDEMYRD